MQKEREREKTAPDDMLSWEGPHVDNATGCSHNVSYKLPCSVSFRYSNGFNLGGTTLVQRFENYITAMNITGDARQKALLLQLAGELVHDIYDTLAAEADTHADVKQKLRTYF